MKPSPYDLAWYQYHRYGLPECEWPLLVGLHFRHGAIVSTPDAFIMARLVNVDAPDEVHFSPFQSRPDGNCWMIWIAAGNLDALLELWKSHPTEWISYTRRDSTRLRRVKAIHFFRHGLAKNQNSAAATANAAASVSNWARA